MPCGNPRSHAACLNPCVSSRARYLWRRSTLAIPILSPCCEPLLLLQILAKPVHARRRAKRQSRFTEFVGTVVAPRRVGSQNRIIRILVERESGSPGRFLTLLISGTCRQRRSWDGQTCRSASRARASLDRARPAANHAVSAKRHRQASARCASGQRRALVSKGYNNLNSNINPAQRYLIPALATPPDELRFPEKTFYLRNNYWGV